MRPIRRQKRRSAFRLHRFTTSSTEHLNSKINTLGYPRAALGSVHGVDVIEQQLSGYYVANEISGIYPGMMITIEYDHWSVFRQMTPSAFVKLLKKLVGKVKLSAFKKHPQGP